MRTHEYYTDDWDDDQYLEWVTDSIHQMADANRKKALNAVQEIYPDASYGAVFDQYIQDINDYKGRYSVDVKISILEIRDLHIKVDFDPMEDDEACEKVYDTLNDILGSVQFIEGPRKFGAKEKLLNPKVEFDDVDFGDHEIIIPLMFTYDFQYHDDAL